MTEDPAPTVEAVRQAIDRKLMQTALGRLDLEEVEQIPTPDADLAAFFQFFAAYLAGLHHGCTILAAEADALRRKVAALEEGQ